MNEYVFETELIKRLSTGSSSLTGESVTQFKKRLWEYKSSIRTLDDLWMNFKKILENHNQNTLDRPLSVVEFDQVKKVISELRTPYEAGQFLYGLNGVSQVEVDLDDGRHVFLTVFDQKHIGAGDTVYQVVNQIECPFKIKGKKNRRFDTTLLINGLPIIHIEEKTAFRDVNEALNQIEQYIDENQFSGIYSTVQILVALTPNNVKYMANTTPDKFNKDFAFNWQRRNDGSVVRNWMEFVDSMLSIPMAHQMATNYMILDGTKNKQSLKVMRPYQVFATQEVIDRLKRIDFSLGQNKVGYIWHTTGSGKTITSFKTAWLASRMPNVEKVVFLVDRIALTNQTNESYKAYDPDGDVLDIVKTGNIQDTSNTRDLGRKLKNADNNIVVTSVQKLNRLIKSKSFKAPHKNFVFIVDEAHRSTGGDSFEAIQKFFPRSAWIGYTGTPMFDNKAVGSRTEDIFGPLLHAYTIREAIADRNVLGFKVDFETTIDEEDMKSKYLPSFYSKKYPEWREDQIQHKINNLTQEDMDDAVEPSFYDENEDHIRLVVEDIFKNWRNRSSDGRYNALFTTHVGGGRASIPMALMYFREFQRINGINREKGDQTLKVAITFSENTSNNATMLESNKGLFEAINVYNKQFNTSFGMDNVSGYTQDVTSRLNKTASDKNFLDIVIVVDQLLTGFDAPELNTLYVDRTLKGSNLIQAYSRTNRIENMQSKPWGRIVNYRWPSESERQMNDALAIYANQSSADLKKPINDEPNKPGVLAEDFNRVFKDVKKSIEEIRLLSVDFTQLPPSEKQQEELFDILQQYSTSMAKLKQYEPKEVDGELVGFDYNHPEKILESLGITSDEEVQITVVLKNELIDRMAKEKNIPRDHIKLRMVHVKDIRVDYDYLTELVQDLLNQVHDNQCIEAAITKQKIDQFAKGLEDREYAAKITNASDAIMNGHYKAEQYPVTISDSETIIHEANNINLDRVFQDFRIKWGIVDVITSQQMRRWFSGHRYGLLDLDDSGQIQRIMAEGSQTYKSLSHDEEVQALSKIKYRNSLRDAIYSLADELFDNF